MSEVYVRWYNKVVAGQIVNQQDMFGMVAVSIPIQGAKVTALFQPQHVYKTPLEANHDYPLTSYSAQAVQHPDVGPSVSETINTIIETQKTINEQIKNGPSEDWLAIQKFKEAHWNHEKNMLDLEYWEEFDKMYHAYQRKRRGMVQEHKPQHEIKMEYPQTEEDVYQYIAPKKQEPLQLKDVIIPSSGNTKPTFFKELVQPRTIGKQITVTELSLF